MTRADRAQTWAVKAFVEATPTSTPRVGGQHHVGLAGHSGLVIVDEGGGPKTLSLAPLQRRQGVRCLARLRDRQSQRGLGDGGIAVAELGGDLHVHRQVSDPFEQIFRRQARKIGGSAGNDLYTVYSVETCAARQLRLARHGVEVGGKGVLAGVRLVVDLLLHEVPVIALLHHGGGCGDLHHRSVGGAALRVKDLRPVMVDGHVVALIEIGDAGGERADGEGVRADEHLPIAKTDHQRRASPRAHDEVVLALHQHA